MISSFEFPHLWEANSDIQLLIAMHEMDLAVLWQTSNLQELITGYNIYNIWKCFFEIVLYFSLGILVHQKRAGNAQV